MKRSLAYQIAVDIRERNASLLFQRLNYFYIVMAFLIAAVMTSYAISNQSNQTYVTSIRTVLVIFGLVISLYFAFLNYWNTRILAGIRDYTLELEVGDFEEYINLSSRPYRSTENIVDNVVTTGFFRLILGLLSELIAFTCVFFHIRTNWSLRITRGLMANHTYVTPIIFSILWIIIIIISF